jgi:hypothetical protein
MIVTLHSSLQTACAEQKQTDIMYKRIVVLERDDATIRGELRTLEQANDALRERVAVLEQQPTPPLPSPPVPAPPQVISVTGAELSEATNGFPETDVIGRGGSSRVYRGKWRDKAVAVKRLNISTTAANQARQLFMQELQLTCTSCVTRKQCNVCVVKFMLCIQVHLMCCRHENIVPAFAYCADPPCLVYPLFEAGSLQDVLEDGARLGRMSWQARVTVVCGILRALEYLHTPTPTKPQIVHRYRVYSVLSCWSG